MIETNATAGLPTDEPITRAQAAEEFNRRLNTLQADVDRARARGAETDLDGKTPLRPWQRDAALAKAAARELDDIVPGLPPVAKQEALDIAMRVKPAGEAAQTVAEKLFPGLPREQAWRTYANAQAKHSRPRGVDPEQIRRVTAEVLRNDRRIQEYVVGERSSFSADAARGVLSGLTYTALANAQEPAEGGWHPSGRPAKWEQQLDRTRSQRRG